MRSRHHQAGLGWFGFIVLIGAIAFIADVVLTCLPLYLNQMKITEAVHKVAGAGTTAGGFRRDLQRYWDINSIDTLQPADVVFKQSDKGRFLSYDYEARGHLFYNVYVVLVFKENVPLSGIGAVE